LITKGPVIKEQLSALVGALFWVLHYELIGADLYGFGGAISVAAGYLAIVFISAGVCTWVMSNSDSRPSAKTGS
jgi:hypothetical protein